MVTGSTPPPVLSLEEVAPRVAAACAGIAVPRIVASGNAAVPFTVLSAIDAALPAYRLNVLNAGPGIPDREGVVLETSFVGRGMRGSPRLAYVPSRLSLVPELWRVLHPDVVVLHTSVPRAGKVSLGVEVNVLPAAVEAVRARGGLVVAQLNPRMPYTFGDAELDVGLVDVAVEVDEPLREHLPAPPDDASAAIGERVAHLVADGATLQTGIGAVPDAALAGLRRTRRGMRVWTEMFSDGVLALERAGVLDRDRPVTASFVLGSEELYRWVDGNRRVVLRRTEVANDPAVISRQPAMTSINTALQVDLFGQVNASRLEARIHSGFGGQTDFLVGALHAKGGQALIALRSWHPRADVSTVVPLLGEPTTSFQPSAVVTENGVAPVWGHDEREQAHALIENAAHPRVRAELREEAHHLGLR